MTISLKISNIVGNELELIQRVKKIQSPGKKTLLKALADGNWGSVYQELLFRIELYSEAKVLNYTRQNLNTIVDSIRKVGIPTVVTELVRKYVPVAQQEVILQQFIDSQEVIEEQLSSNKQQLESNEWNGYDVDSLATEVFYNMSEQFEEDIENGTISSWNDILTPNDDDDNFANYFDSCSPTDFILEVIDDTDVESSITGENIVEAILRLVEEKIVEKTNSSDLDNIEIQPEISNPNNAEDISSYSPKKAFEFLYKKHNDAPHEDAYVSYNNLTLKIEREFKANKIAGRIFTIEKPYFKQIKTEKFKNLRDYSAKCISEIIEAVIQNKIDIKKNSNLNESDYESFFRQKLQDFGVESPAELSIEQKSTFFNEISEQWESQCLEKNCDDDLNEDDNNLPED